MKVTATTSKGRRQYDIPDRWEQLSTGTYQRIIAEWDQKDVIRLFSILSGIEYSGIAESNSQELEEYMLICTRFIYQDAPSFKRFEVPSVITVMGKSCTIPPRVGRMTIGQNIMIKQKLSAAIVGAGIDISKPIEPQQLVKIYEGMISFAVAVYLQPQISGDGKRFDDAKVEEIEAEVKKLPITQTYSLGFFLFAQLMNPGADFQASLSLSLQRLTNAARRLLKLPKSPSSAALMSSTSLAAMLSVLALIRITCMSVPHLIRSLIS